MKSIKKKQNGLEQSKMKNHPPYPSEESNPVTGPLGNTVEETGDLHYPI